MRERPHTTRLQRERRLLQPIGNLEKPKSKLEQYLKFTPLAYVSLVIYSYIGLEVYYSRFGLDILGHSNISEIIISPLDDFLFALLISVFLYAINELLFKVESIANESYVTKIKVSAITTLMGLTIILMVTFLKVPFYWILIFSGVLGFLLFYSSRRFYQSAFFNNHIQKYSRQYFTIFGTIVFLTGNIAINYHLAESFLRNQNSKRVELQIKSTNARQHSRLIGETYSTLFLWSDSTQTARALRKSEVISVDYLPDKNIGKTETVSEDSTSLKVLEPLLPIK